MRSLKDNNFGSVVPLALFILTIIGCGALYSLLFIEIGIPTFSYMIPEGDAKIYIMMVIYAVPLFVLIIGMLALFLSGLKRTRYARGGF